MRHVNGSLCHSGRETHPGEEKARKFLGVLLDEKYTPHEKYKIKVYESSGHFKGSHAAWMNLVY